jgi:hypothetical protein
MAVLLTETQMTRRLFPLLALLTVAGSAGFYMATAAAQSDDRLLMQRGVPLEKRVRPNAGRVTLDADQSPPLEVLPPAGVSAAEWSAQNAHLVAIVSVQDLQPELTADHDWIQTRVSATILELLKDSTKSFGVGSVLEFDVDGGELALNGTTVTAQKSWARPIGRGNYLLFASLTESGNLLVSEDGLFQINDDHTLTRLRKHEAPQVKQMEEAGAQTAIDTIRKTAQQ